MNKVLFRRFCIGILIIWGMCFIGSMFFSARNGEQAPDFDAVLIDGSNFSLSNLKGKYVLLDFWGSWCPPCRKENPQLVALHKKYNNILTIVTVGLEKNKDSGKKVAIKDGFLWKNQIIEENKFVLMSSIARKYGVTEIPAKFLISPDGKILGELSFKKIKDVLNKID